MARWAVLKAQNPGCFVFTWGYTTHLYRKLYREYYIKNPLQGSIFADPVYRIELLRWWERTNAQRTPWAPKPWFFAVYRGCNTTQLYEDYFISHNIKNPIIFSNHYLYVCSIMGMWYCWCFFREILFFKNHPLESYWNLMKKSPGIRDILPTLNGGGLTSNGKPPAVEALGRTWNKRLDFGSSWHTPWYVALVCNKKASESFFPPKNKGGWKRDTMENTKKTGWGVRLCLWFVCFLGLVGVDGLRVNGVSWFPE